MLLPVLLVAVSALLLVFLYVKLHIQRMFFKKRGIPHLDAWSEFKNSISVMTKKKLFLDVVKETYKAFPEERYFGTFQFGLPNIVLRDLDLLKQITIKDFDHFTDHRLFFSAKSDDLFSKNLFSMKGEEWREMRATLSPAFTSAKMRNMFHFMDECGKNFVSYFQGQKGDVIDVEMRDIVTKYTNDVIATASFGIKCDSLVNTKNEFYTMGKKITDQNTAALFKFALLNFMPKISKIFNVGLFAPEVSEFFKRIVRETIKTRETNNIIRPDMIHLLMEARKGRLQHEATKVETDTGFATVEESQVGKTDKYKKKDLTDEDIAAQAMIFFFAGFDTVASTVSFMALELAKNPDIQERLQKEIDETLAQGNGKVTYEELSKMKYMDQVVTETLRKWTPGFQSDRVCVKDYLIQPVKPREKPYLVKKGEMVLIPTAGFHYDPKYYPDPERFDPERFSDENKKNLVPGSYLPFGVGPRNCIGSRFALLQLKTLYFHILSKFDLVFTEKTQLPIKLTTVGFNMRPEGGFQMGLKRRKVSA